MRKRAFLALSGVAALGLVALPFLSTDASAVIVPDETVTIDYIDVTNGNKFVIKDQGLSDYLRILIDDGEWCATVDEDNVLSEIQPGEDPYPALCFYINDDDEVAVYDDFLEDGLRVFENVTFDTYVRTVDNSVVQVGDPTDIVPGASVKMVQYNFSKIYDGTGFALISGEDQTYVKGSESGLEFHTTGEVRNLDVLTVDSNELSEGDYDAENGSIILTLKPSYLDGLSTGKHTLKISFEDRYAGAASIEVDFAVEDNPDTADLPVETFIVFGSCLALGATSMAYMINKKSRR
ncbi:hypothetical protein IKM56_04015 [Candidatus Saccharibacteria bacterium]|nr:hypothetical protein [Candidatus Saccharibacteria bacterium]